MNSLKKLLISCGIATALTFLVAVIISLFTKNIEIIFAIFFGIASVIVYIAIINFQPYIEKGIPAFAATFAISAAAFANIAIKNEKTFIFATTVSIFSILIAVAASILAERIAVLKNEGPPYKIKVVMCIIITAVINLGIIHYMPIVL
jgi:hypothetical protein